MGTASFDRKGSGTSRTVRRIFKKLTYPTTMKTTRFSLLQKRERTQADTCFWLGSPHSCRRAICCLDLLWLCWACSSKQVPRQALRHVRDQPRNFPLMLSSYARQPCMPFLCCASHNASTLLTTRHAASLSHLFQPRVRCCSGIRVSVLWRG